MEAVDYYKLIYQQTFGMRHHLMDEAESLKRLEAEYEGITLEYGDYPPFIEEIGNGYTRINLAAEAFKASMLPALNKLFIATSRREEGTVEEFESKLEALLQLSKEDKLTVSTAELKEIIEYYKKKNYPTVSHSTTYREQYHPHYRVIDASYTVYLDVISEIIKLEKVNRPQIIAIDGRCGSGKTTFSLLIEQLFDCNVFHMDDFFLPKELKTEERLNEPGSNVHYERVLQEVIQPLSKGENVQLIPFNCAVNDLEQAQAVPYKKMNFIEGVYSMHPVLEPYYDYKFFMTVDAETQIERIAERSHAKLDKFIREWIPLEEKYFKSREIEEKADGLIHTSFGQVK